MNVSDALESRISCRQFKPDPIPEDLVRRLLDGASRSPSNGNIQPWHAYALTGAPLKALVDDVGERMKDMPRGEGTEFEPYPQPMPPKYKERAFKCGEDLYATIGVARDDKPGRIAQFRRNFRLFDAPVGIFLYVDRCMGVANWADVGMFAQSLMLLAREYGLHTCPQCAWAQWHGAVGEHLNPPDELMLYCGIGLGYMDEDAPINTLRTDREPVDGFAKLVGF
ncbi:MAG: nitroreductase [Alphaproteobacteria bacterium]